MLSIWPEDIKQSVPESALTILKEHASELYTFTNYAASGVVNSQYNEYKNLFEVEFIISSKRFENYAVKIFSVTYNETLWPVQINLENEIRAEIFKEPESTKTKTSTSENKIWCKDKDEFINNLRVIFNTQRVRFIIQAIMAQSK